MYECANYESWIWYMTREFYQLRSFLSFSLQLLLLLDVLVQKDYLHLRPVWELCLFKL